eukprot:1161128-Pelagomonas_calceolata.AAC.3
MRGGVTGKGGKPPTNFSNLVKLSLSCSSGKADIAQIHALGSSSSRSSQHDQIQAAGSHSFPKVLLWLAVKRID